MRKGKLKIATCQFAVSGSIGRNYRQIRFFMRRAKKAGAELLHFPECALSGYAGVDFDNFDNFDWRQLTQKTHEITILAKRLNLWVALGSIHKLRKSGKLHNSLYLISPDGQIASRYDKRFCLENELENYIPGGRFVTFAVNGVKCALLICFDCRFPEIYRRLYKKGVNCIFQSFYNARQAGPSVHTHIMRQTMQCRAATNHFWASCANSSGYYSPYPSYFIQPDGKIVKQLRINRPGMMINTVDMNKKFYDPMKNFRDMAINGKLGNISASINSQKSAKTNK